MFVTDSLFRGHYGDNRSVVIWLNLDNREQVDELYAEWNGNGAKIVSPPDSKPWKLYEFTAVDLGGNQFRLFYDFSSDKNS